MRIFLPTQVPQVDLTKPVIEFYENGPYLRIEAQGQPTRYLSQKKAVELLKYIGSISFEEGKEFLI